MRSNMLALAVALSVAALAAPAGAAVSDFRLPADQPQQTPPPDLQGPVAPDVPESRQASQPEPTEQATQAATSPPPAVELPEGLQPRPQASPTRAETPPPASDEPAAAPSEAATAPPLPEPEPAPAVAAPAPSPAPPTPAEPEEPRGFSWLWLLAAVPLVLAGAVWAARRRRSPGEAAAPQIERPRVGSAPAPSNPPAPRPATAAPAEPLQVSLEPLRLSLTLLNATLTYRLELTNRGAAPLTGVAIGADMISAHASLSREEQLAGPGTGAAAQRVERLEPGETRVVEGEFRLPFPQIVPIRQGNAALLLPLARFRVAAEGAAPLVRTFVVGQPGQGSGLQPFRLDQGPRVYPKLAQRAFA